jgi:hypothetical protein
MLFGHTPEDFQQLKLVLLDLTGLSRDALHIYAGMAAFVAARLIWRWRGGWMVAWLAALAVAYGAEWLDMQAENDPGSLLKPEPDHWHDIWNTMVWPTVLLLVGHWLHTRPKTRADHALSGGLADQPAHDSCEQPPPV